MATPDQLILDARDILVLCHSSPDGDAIGALLGLGRVLEALGKRATLACADPVPREYEFLPGVGEIVRRPQGPFDLVIALDSSDLARLGDSYDSAQLEHLPLLNVDHHVTNTQFGTVNWVDAASASTCEMVLLLADKLGVPLTPPIATCLLTGVVTDTRGFSTPNTSLHALQAAVRLVAAGANLPNIAYRTLMERPFESLRMWGQVFTDAHLEDEIVWASLPLQLVEETDPSTNGLRGLVSFLIGTEEARIAALLTEREHGRVEVSLRSKEGVDVSAVALALGGGGHPRAAGCTVEGTLSEVEQSVLKELRALLEAEKRADGQPL